VRLIHLQVGWMYRLVDQRYILVPLCGCSFLLLVFPVSLEFSLTLSLIEMRLLILWLFGWWFPPSLPSLLLSLLCRVGLPQASPGVRSSVISPYLCCLGLVYPFGAM
jgi:hypothetical protein